MRNGHNQGTFPQNQGTFFQFSRNGRGDFPLPPCSYTLVVTLRERNQARFELFSIIF